MSKSELIYGMHAVDALLEKQPERVIEVYALKGRDDERLGTIVEKAREWGVSVQFMQRKALDDKSEGEQHQGIIARVKAAKVLTDNDLDAYINHLEVPPFLLILDGVTDPHNLGACLRTVDGSGADAVIVPADRACGITPVVSKVAAGAANSVPLFTVNNLSRTLDDLKALGIWIIGTAEDADQDVWQMDFSGPCAVVLGGEGSGMRPLTRKHCDLVTRIPMAGVVESLNVSVATGVVLYEVMRQRLS